MIDINIIRERPDWVKEQIAKLNDVAPVDEIVGADNRRRELLLKVEELRRQRNESSKQIGRWMGTLKKYEADLRLVETGQEVGQQREALFTQVNALRKMKPERWVKRLRLWMKNYVQLNCRFGKICSGFRIFLTALFRWGRMTATMLL